MSEVMIQGIRFSIAGLSVVFVVLFLISAVVATIRWIDARFQEEDFKGPEVDPLHLVLIASAVAFAHAGKARIRKIRRLAAAEGTRNPWCIQGRATLHESHLVGMRERK